VTTTALFCGNVHRPQPDQHGLRWVDVPSRPGKGDLDPVLAALDGRLLVRGTDADLAAVILRLLRAGRLADVIIGYLPVAESPSSLLWKIPVGDAALTLACSGDPRPVPVIRDDVGGVLVGSGIIAPVMGQVYCDDQRVVSGAARAVEIAPDPRARPLPKSTADPLADWVDPALDGVRVTAVRRGLLRRRREVFRGRAVQASFRSATVVCDGVEQPRPADKWVWYRHTEDLQLVCPS
jgi:hypothetical protein